MNIPFKWSVCEEDDEEEMEEGLYLPSASTSPPCRAKYKIVYGFCGAVGGGTGGFYKKGMDLNLNIA